MVKRLCLMALVICLVFSQLSMLSWAAASETDNFAGGYTLSGGGGMDMVAIAMAQEGRTGKDFGYDDQWCAYFVSDCARIAGETGAIPAHGTCTYLYQNILDAGGKLTTQDPQPGDICFINWSGGSRMSHVEIVYQVGDGMVYTIGGNSGSEKHYSTRCVKRHDPIDPGCILAIVRPNYGAAAPVNPPAEPKPQPPKPAPPPKPVTYQIRFDSDGAQETFEPQTKTKGKAMMIPETVPTREGYIFLGWLCGEETFYAPGSTFSQEGDASLVAIWEAADSVHMQPIELWPKQSPARVNCLKSADVLEE